MDDSAHRETYEDGADGREHSNAHSEMPRLIRLSEAAAHLGISRTTAWEMEKQGRFPVPVIRVGSSPKVNPEHLRQFIATGVPVRLEGADA